MSARTIGDVLRVTGDECRERSPERRAAALLFAALDADLGDLVILTQWVLASQKKSVQIYADDAAVYSVAVLPLSTDGYWQAWLNVNATVDAFRDALPSALEALRAGRRYGPPTAPCEPWCEADDRDQFDHVCATARLIDGGPDDDPWAVRLEHYRNEIGQFIPASPACISLCGFGWDVEHTATQAREIAAATFELAALLEAGGDQ